MMTRTAIVLASAAATLGSQAIGVADTITADLEADARVNRGSPDASYGGDNVLTVRRGTDANTFKSYLRFDLSNVPDLADVTAVTLNLTAVNSSGVVEVAWWDQTVSVFGLQDAAWDEGTVTWNNAPANNTANSGSPAASSFLSPAQLLGSFNAMGTTGTYAFSFDLNNPTVAAWFADATDGGTITLMLSTEGTSNQLIGSKEGNFDPSLGVTYVPEPGTIALAALGGAAMLCRRRG